MNTPDIFQYSQEHLVKMLPHSVVDDKLSANTREFIHTIGLRNSEELGFDFTGKTMLLSNQVIGFEGVTRGRVVCLDTRRAEVIRWSDDEAEFINTSAEQFVRSVESYEFYIRDIQGKEVYGSFYSQNGIRSNRTPYAAYLTEKLKSIDSAIFENGYYWPAFLERIESGL